MRKRIRKKSLSELSPASLKNLVLSSQEMQDLARGIDLFNDQMFWEAHEAWEDIWQNHPEDSRFFIQALIQLAAAYHQFRRRIYRGFIIHIRRAQERLELFPGVFLGIDVETLLSAVRRTTEFLDAHDLDTMDFSSVEIPRITNLPSQSESCSPQP